MEKRKWRKLPTTVGALLKKAIKEGDKEKIAELLPKNNYRLFNPLEFALKKYFFQSFLYMTQFFDDSSVKEAFIVAKCYGRNKLYRSGYFNNLKILQKEWETSLIESEQMNIRRNYF